MFFAILETAMVFWSSHVLEDAVASAARDIYTGGFQKTNAATLANSPQLMPGVLKTAICSHVVAMFDCSANLTVDVRAYTDAEGFPSSITSPIVTDSSGHRSVDSSFGQYQNPGPNTIVLVRVVVRYPVFASLLDATASNLTGTTRILMSTVAFRTEPYV